MKHVTVSRTPSGKYFASILCEAEMPQPEYRGGGFRAAGLVKGLLSNHCLAKSIGDAGWSGFIRMLDYKGRWYGCYVPRVDRFFPSSKRCHVCGHINRFLRLSDRRWVCPECETSHDRDENASLNLLHFGRAGTARTYTPVESWVADSQKPEAPPQAVGQFTTHQTSSARKPPDSSMGRKRLSNLTE